MVSYVAAMVFLTTCQDIFGGCYSVAKWLPWFSGGC